VALRPHGLRTLALGLGTLAATVAAMGSTAAAANAALGVACPDPTTTASYCSVVTPASSRWSSDSMTPKRFQSI